VTERIEDKAVEKGGDENYRCWENRHSDYRYAATALLNKVIAEKSEEYGRRTTHPQASRYLIIVLRQPKEPATQYSMGEAAEE
jgi:hypothetical protein